MICWTIGQTQFQVRAAAVLIDQGRLLVHRAVGDAFWCLPGGRVEAGEDSARTVERELLEELGERVQAERLLLVVENFYEHADLGRHEIGFYHRCHLAPGSALAQHQQPFAGIELGLPAPLEFAWVPLAEVPALTLYPECLRTLALDEPDAVTRHVIERG